MSLFKPNEQGTLIVPPRIIGMMTAVAFVFVAHPRYRLTYVDGTQEEATCPELEQGADVIAITAAVQAKRSPGTRKINH